MKIVIAISFLSIFFSSFLAFDRPILESLLWSCIALPIAIFYSFTIDVPLQESKESELKKEYKVSKLSVIFAGLCFGGVFAAIIIFDCLSK